LRRGGQRRSPSPRPGETANGPAPARQLGKPDPWEREVLQLLVRFPECFAAARAAIRAEQIVSFGGRTVFDACCRLADVGEVPAFARLMLEFDDPAMKSFLVELDENAAEWKIGDPHVLLEELIKSSERRESQKEFPSTNGLLREGRLDESQELALLRQKIQKERVRHGISAPTDG
jgi:hypothetical protein